MIGHGFLLETMEIQRQMNWETAVFVGIPASGAVGYIAVRLVAMFLKSQKEWREQLAEAIGSSNEIVDRNSRALVELNKTIGQFSGVIQKCKGPKCGSK